MKTALTILLLALACQTAWAAESVNVNTASAEEIAEALTGVGIGTAEKIVQYREENGAFSHPDELVNVKGIGMKLVDKNRDRIVVDVNPPEQGH